MAYDPDLQNNIMLYGFFYEHFLKKIVELGGKNLSLLKKEKIWDIVKNKDGVNEDLERITAEFDSYFNGLRVIFFQESMILLNVSGQDQ